MEHKITFGADPEFFVIHKTKGIVPVCGLFGGTKKNPVVLSEDGGYLEDGAVIEFNVRPAENILDLRERLAGLYALFETKFPDYALCHQRSFAHFSVQELRKYPQTQVLGCDADLWAYGIRELPQASTMRGIRCAGGHLHIGISPWPEKLLTRSVVRLLDMCLMPLLVHHCDAMRWKYYGLPGLYRETQYGVEYRSPDNRWCSLSKADNLPVPNKHGGKFYMSDALVTELQEALKLFVRLASEKGGNRANNFIDRVDERVNFTHNAQLPKALKSPIGFVGGTREVLQCLHRELK